MTIHHDKLAYGKLAAASEEISENELLSMLAALEKDEDEECAKTETTAPKAEDEAKQRKER